MIINYSVIKKKKIFFFWNNKIRHDTIFNNSNFTLCILFIYFDSKYIFTQLKTYSIFFWKNYFNKRPRKMTKYTKLKFFSLGKISTSIQRFSKITPSLEIVYIFFRLYVNSLIFNKNKSNESEIQFIFRTSIINFKKTFISFNDYWIYII